MNKIFFTAFVLLSFNSLSAQWRLNGKSTGFSTEATYSVSAELRLSAINHFLYRTADNANLQSRKISYKNGVLIAETSTGITVINSNSFNDRNLAIKTNQLINEDILVFPNPASDICNIIIPKTMSANWCFTLTDINGKVCMEKKLSGETELQIQLAEFPSGNYFFTLSSGTIIRTGKIIRN